MRQQTVHCLESGQEFRWPRLAVAAAKRRNRNPSGQQQGAEQPHRTSPDVRNAAPPAEMASN